MICCQFIKTKSSKFLPGLTTSPATGLCPSIVSSCRAGLKAKQNTIGCLHNRRATIVPVGTSCWAHGIMDGRFHSWVRPFTALSILAAYVAPSRTTHPSQQQGGAPKSVPARLLHPVAKVCGTLRNRISPCPSGGHPRARATALLFPKLLESPDFQLTEGALQRPWDVSLITPGI